MTETFNFDAITHHMPDVLADGDQILADAQTGNAVMPFGAELFSDFELTSSEVGGLACAATLNSKADDSDTFHQNLQ